jgi:hypothetical protein
MQGAQYKEKATTYAIVGLFVLGFIFGPLAILNANRAKALNHTATVGRFLGGVSPFKASSYWLGLSSWP